MHDGGLPGQGDGSRSKVYVGAYCDAHGADVLADNPSAKTALGTAVRPSLDNYQR